MKQKIELIEKILSDIYCNLEDPELAMYVSEVLQIIDDILCNWEDDHELR